MHPNKAFRQTPEAAALEFARERGFGTLAVNGEAGPIVSHIPFLLVQDGRYADLHLVRSNPIARAGEGPALIAVNGPDGYVSPDWYGVPDQVPTWNYIALHLRGRLVSLPDSALSDLIDRQSAFFEEKLLPKKPWTAAKMTDGVKERMMRSIQPFRFFIETVESTWKLNQNKPSAVRLAAADQIEDGVGLNLSDLSTYMKTVE